MNRLTIITATYNSAQTLPYCIDSIIKQNMGVDYVIVDGASMDDTPIILEKYRKYISHSISEPDLGIYDGLNKGIIQSNGDVIGLLHADDFYPNKNVLNLVSKTFQDQNIEACYGDLNYVIDADPTKIMRKWKSGDYHPDKFYWGWMPPHPTFFVRRSAYEKYGLFNLNMGTSADYELMLRFMLKHGIKTVYIPEVLVHMRTGGVSNRSILNRISANRLDRKAWEVNGLKPYPWTIWMKPIRKIPQWFV